MRQAVRDSNNVTPSALTDVRLYNSEDGQQIPLLLEPRVMLDANLEWNLSDATSISDAIHGFAETFNEQFHDISDFLEHFETQVGDAASLIDALTGGAGSSGASEQLHGLLDAIGRIEGAIKELQQGTASAVNALGDATAGTLSVALEDVQVDGKDVITFSDEDGDASSVNVSVNLDPITADLDALLTELLGDASVSEDLSVTTASSGAITFTMNSSVETSGGSITSMGLDVTDFNFPSLFEFGGVINICDTANLNMGLLDLSLSDATLASMRLAVTSTGLDLGFNYDVGTGSATALFNADNMPSVEAQIKQIGATDFEKIAANVSYELLTFSATGSISTSGVSHDFSTDFTLSSVLDTGTGSSSFGEFINHLNFGMDIDLGDSGLDAAAQDTIEKTIEALSVIGSDELLAYFDDIGQSLKSILTDSLFDIDIPLTDLNVSDILDDMSNVLSSLAEQFHIAADALGFGDDDPGVDLIQAVDSYESGEITSGILDALTGYSSLTLSVIDSAGNIHTETVELNDTVLDTGLSVEERLTELSSLISAQLAAYNLAVSVAATGTALTISASKMTAEGKESYATFAVTSAQTKGGEKDEDFGLENLGFDSDDLLEIEGLIDAESDAVEGFVAFGDAITSATTGDIKFDDLTGITSLRYVVMVNNVEQYVDIQSETGWSSVADLASDLNAALHNLGLGVTAAQNGGGISFSLDAGETRNISVAVDASQLVKAHTFDELKTWVVSELNQTLEGIMLELTTDGELVFDFSGLEFSLDYGADTPASFDASDIGLDFLSGLSLSATLNASLSAVLNGAIGIDLTGMASDAIGEGSTALSESISHGGSVIGLMEEHIFFDHVGVSVDIDATADQITGAADVGLVAVTIGSTHPVDNFLVFDARLDIEVVGTDADGVYSDRVMLGTVLDAILTSFPDAEDGTAPTEAAGVSSLIGRMDLTGGIVTNGEGRGVASSGDEVGSLTDVQRIDLDSYDGDRSALAELLVQLGDISIDVVGIEGLNEDLIDGIGFTVQDLFSLSDTAQVAFISEDEDALDAIMALTDLQDGDILDSLVAIANMLEIVSETLSEKLPFLDENIPVLNFSVLDAVSFSADFLQAINELQDDPQSGLDVLQSYLEGVFGDDTVTIEWDGEDQTILFDLTFSFLDDYTKSVGFNLDLDSILGDALDDYLGEYLTDVVTSLVDVNGDASLVFDPLLTFNFAFGIDLSDTLAAGTLIAGLDTKLSDLSSVSTVNLNPNGKSELKITWTDQDSGQTKFLQFNADGYETVGQLVDALDEAVKNAFGSTAGVSFDTETGQIIISDSAATQTDDAGVVALFGADSVSAADADTIALSSDFSDYAGAYAFTLTINGENVDISVDALEGRTEAGFVAALNAALANASIARNVLGGSAIAGTTVSTSMLFEFSVVDGQIVLKATNFAQASGYDALSFSVGAEDVSKNIAFSVSDYGGSNISALMGFDADTDLAGTGSSGDVLYIDEEIGAPRVFIDTEATNITFSFTAGGQDLSLDMALGPVEIAVVNGYVMINAGDGSEDPAFLKIAIADIDGDEHEGQFDLSALDDLSSFTDLFNVDVQVGIDLKLPFSDSIGLFNPVENYLSWNATLLSHVSGADLDHVDMDHIDHYFEGVLVDLKLGKELDLPNFEFHLPDLGEYFENMNVLALLNNPQMVLGGLDMIFGQVQALIDDYLGDIHLPIIGDALANSATLFEQLRYYVIDVALDYASTPLEDGSMPTTVQLLTGFINDTLNSLFGTGDMVYIQAFLNTDGKTDQSYIYGVLNFSATLFSQYVDVDFDLGIPGLNLEVEEGSKILLEIGYTVNIGFGYDKNGFFLLNDTDHAEVSLDFLVDAGTFEGSMKVLNILGVSAKAVTTGEDGFVDPSKGGTAEVTASLVADLFGDQGLTIFDPSEQGDGDAVTKSSAYRDLSGVTSLDSFGNELDFEKVLYTSQLDTSKLIKFTFEAHFDIQITLEANIYNPANGKPIVVGGVQIMPTVATELIYEGGYTAVDGLRTDALEFSNVRVDATQLYEAFLAPIIDPINDFITPIANAFAFMDEMPFNLMASYLSRAFPLFGLVNSVRETVTEINEFLTAMQDSGGWIIVGTFDLAGSVGDASQSGLDADSSSADLASGVTFESSAAHQEKKFGEFGNKHHGFSAEINLITDPMNILNLLLGKFDQIEIVTVGYTLFDLDVQVNLSDAVLDTIKMPKWLSKVIGGAFDFTIDLDMESSFDIVFTLDGIVNFVQTHDPERLLDSINLDTDLLYFYAHFDAGLSANLGVVKAGVKAGGGVTIDVNLNDINHDGLLSFTELLVLLDAAAHPGDRGPFGYLFDGTFEVDFNLELYASINLLVLKAKFSTDVINLDEGIHLGGYDLPTQISNDVDDGDTAILNVGANAAGSMSDITEDGDDKIVVSGPNSPIEVTYTSGGDTISGKINQDAGALIIPAGEGDNVIDLSAVNGTTTITYSGAGKDTIKLPDKGVHVVFAGAGDDEISAGASAEGLYIIFGEAGSDKVTIPGGTVVYIGDDSYGLREKFETKFANGGVTVDKILDLVGLASDYTVESGADANYTVGSAHYNLADLITNYTAGTQNLASDDADMVTIGNTSGIIMTGGGDDVIEGTLTGEGDLTILTGAGNDRIIAAGRSLYIEGGAGADIIQVDSPDQNGHTEVWGWGAQGGESGLLEGNADLANLLLKDGADILIGGNGSDALYGQLGNDILEGNLGDDSLSGGADNDLITGGTFKLVMGGEVIDPINLDISSTLSSGLTISALDSADGDDVISGGVGDDVLIGGGGADTINGGSGNDILIGDFATIKLSSSFVALSAVSDFVNSSNMGGDDLTGGMGNDILIAGGAGEGETETLADLYGNNILVGDFAQISGGKILESPTNITSIASNLGGADTMTSGRGNDMIIGGEGDDTISSGLGGDIVLGDNGTIDIASSQISAVQTANDGNDTITVGVDDASAYGTTASKDLIDIVLGGTGSDKITSESADLITLGDTGMIEISPVALNALRSYQPPASDADEATWAADADSLALMATLARALHSTATSADGDDTIVAKQGNVTGILGGGHDTATIGDGDVILLGDDGTITVTPNGDFDGSLVEMASASSLAAANNDTITLGNGNNRVIAGTDKDVVKMGDGNNLLLTDAGTIVEDTRTETRSFTLTSPSTVSTEAQHSDADDKVTLGNGSNAVILGGGSDVLLAGNGMNQVIGDSGVIEWNDTEDVSMHSTSSDIGGDDEITTGTGSDFIIGGAGGDTIQSGDGDNRILGDSGQMVWSGEKNWTLETVDSGIGGDDEITTGTGSDFIIGGAGGDTIQPGDGDNRILGDSGKLYWLDQSWTLETVDSGIGGADHITAGAGDDVILAGADADTVDAGDGNNWILGDSGEIIWNGDAFGHLLTTDSAIGGADNITSGSGKDIILGGAKGDVINAGDGGNRIIGDNGAVVWSHDEDGQMTTADNSIGGDDTITSGLGDDIILAGVGADVVFAGSGDNTVLGDNGNIVLYPGLSSNILKSMTVTDPDIGGDDTITTLDGEDTIIGGTGSDTIHSGAGADIILGDSGYYISSSVTGTGILKAQVLDYGGNDAIYGEDGNDLIIGGQGDDMISAGNGEDAVAGDDATFTFVNRSDLQTVVLTNQYLGGDDTLTAANTLGDNIMFGQAGSDVMTGGNDDDVMIGDLVTLSLYDHATTYPGQSAADRIGYMISIHIDIAGDDLMFGGAGADTMIGGFGADLMKGGSGDDIIIGDTIIYNRVFSLDDFSRIHGHLTLETNYAYVTGGYDTLFGEEGADIMIGGLGGDMFHGDTASDVLFSDGYTGIFKTTWSERGFEGDTPQWRLYTSNFAGPQAVDVVSNAQQNDVIGSPLTIVEMEGDKYNLAGEHSRFFFTEDVDDGFDQADKFSEALLAVLSTASFMQNLAQLITSGVQGDVLRTSIEQTIRDELGEVWNLDQLEIEQVISATIEFLLDKAVDAPVSVEPDSEVPSPAEPAPNTQEPQTSGANDQPEEQAAAA
ncbi:calcium-binding protein [uncultured Cohaesibacter sp.]|uniref:calcium-binding protein n=1 Tax=uncultured Cohaesibacter sp. TaxID=1002546 RepID=UPI002AA82389|nr:calcium-binding protein [uncultured Cohaesibacter sp.]